MGNLPKSTFNMTDTLTLRYAGHLDERSFDSSSVEAQWAAISRKQNVKIVIDLSSVETISSRGVRTWIQFRKHIQKLAPFEILGLPICFVDVVNQIPEVLGDSHLVSLYAPYYCALCQKEVTQLLILSLYRTTLLQGTPPPISHSECGSLLDFDAVEETYFAAVLQFLKRSLPR
jgi:ABC-type transporter Mla MlaB component